MVFITFVLHIYSKKTTVLANQLLHNKKNYVVLLTNCNNTSLLTYLNFKEY